MPLLSAAASPARPLDLRPGDRLAIIVVRKTDPSRWNLDRLAAKPGEDLELAREGCDDWAAGLDDEDEG